MFRRSLKRSEGEGVERKAERAKADMDKLISAAKEAAERATATLKAAKEAKKSLLSMNMSSNLHGMMVARPNAETDVWGFPDSDSTLPDSKDVLSKEQSNAAWEVELCHLIETGLDRGRHLEEILQDIERSGAPVPEGVIEKVVGLFDDDVQDTDDAMVDHEEDHDSTEVLYNQGVFENLPRDRQVGKASIGKQCTVAGYSVGVDQDVEMTEGSEACEKAAAAFEEMTSEEPASEEELAKAIENGAKGIFVESMYKVLQQIYPGIVFSAEAAAVINDMLVNMTLQVMEQAASLSRTRGNTFEDDFEDEEEEEEDGCSSRDVQSAVRFVFVKELARHAVSEGVRAVTMWCSDRSMDKRKLVFSHEVVATLVRQRVGVTMQNGARIYLTAVIEYLCAELLELSGKRARDDRTGIITLRHVFHAVETDDELRMMLVDNKLAWPRPMILPDNKMTESELQGDDLQDEQVQDQDSRALHEIRDEQHCSEFCIPRREFSKMAKEINAEFTSRGTLSDGALEALQAAAEMFLLKRMQQARRINAECSGADGATSLTRGQFQLADFGT